PVRGRARGRPRGGEGRALPDRPAGRRRHLGGPALGRHGLSARPLPKVPPLREVLPAVGTGRLSERERVTEGPPIPRPLPPPARWIGTLGYLTLYVVGSLGRFGRFLGPAAPLPLIPPPQLR